MDDLVGDAIAELDEMDTPPVAFSPSEIDASDERTFLCERVAGRCQSRCRWWRRRARSL